MLLVHTLNSTHRFKIYHMAKLEEPLVGHIHKTCYGHSKGRVAYLQKAKL